MANLTFNPDTFEYKDVVSEKIDKKTGKPCTNSQILQSREFIPICQAICRDKTVQFYWHHYKVSDYTEIVQFLAVCRVGANIRPVGQLQILQYRNLVTRRYQFSELGFSYSQNKLDLKIYNLMLKSTQITRYESFYEPNGLQAVITQLDVLPEFRKNYIAQALLFLATHSFEKDVKLFIDYKLYTPRLPLQEFKAAPNLSAYSVNKIQTMIERMGFREDIVQANEKLAIPVTKRIIHDKNQPVNACGFKLLFTKEMKPYKYRLDKQFRDYV